MGRLLWHVLDASGEKDMGPKPTLEAAEGIRLSGDSLGRFVSGVTLQSSMFSARVVSDQRIEFRHRGKRIDTAEWGLTGDEFWLKGKVITGDRKLYLTVVLEGNTLKWYDRDGTLSGAALCSKK
jgi:hypothetical protein